jgi:hypothetical protein
MLCEYGCGKEAKYQLMNGKWCCSRSHNSCPTKRATAGYDINKISEKNRNKILRIGKQNNERVKQVYISRYESDPKFCKYCNEKIPYEYRRNRFCNKSCAAAYNNSKGKIKSNLKNYCLSCGESLDRMGRRFCNPTCYSNYRKKKTIMRLENNELKDLHHIRNHVLNIRGNKCQKCGSFKWNGSIIPLEIHHIDGDKKNNKLSNLMVLCPNCHAQTSNYKSKNMKNK